MLENAPALIRVPKAHVASRFFILPYFIEVSSQAPDSLHWKIGCLRWPCRYRRKRAIDKEEKKIVQSRDVAIYKRKHWPLGAVSSVLVVWAFPSMTANSDSGLTTHTRHCSKNSSCDSNPMREIRLLSPFYRQGNGSIERLIICLRSQSQEGETDGQGGRHTTTNSLAPEYKLLSSQPSLYFAPFCSRIHYLPSLLHMLEFRPEQHYKLRSHWPPGLRKHYPGLRASLWIRITRISSKTWGRKSPQMTSQAAFPFLERPPSPASSIHTSHTPSLEGDHHRAIFSHSSILMQFLPTRQPPVIHFSISKKGHF